MYLLPAGESTFLGGVKSMVVDPFPPTQLLSQRLSTRYVPLQNEKILIVMRKAKNVDAKVSPPTPTPTPPLIDGPDKARKITILLYTHWEQGKSINVRHWGKPMHSCRKGGLHL